jgi:hypothetical protein
VQLEVITIKEVWVGRGRIFSRRRLRSRRGYPCGERSELFPAECCAGYSPTALSSFSKQHPGARALRRVAGDVCDDLSGLGVRAPLTGSINPTSTCAVKGAGPQRVQIPPGNWFAPPGSNRSSSGGDETAEASGVEGRLGDLASL